MNVTEVRINRLKNGNGGKLAAFASVTFDDVLVVRDFRVLNGEEGVFVAFPQRQNEKEKKYYDTVFPLSKEFRENISRKVLSEYNGGKEN